jgi:hypothetical protein
MIVTFFAAALSIAARRSPRSISRRVAGATSQACLGLHACHDSVGEALLTPSPFGAWSRQSQHGVRPKIDRLAAEVSWAPSGTKIELLSSWVSAGYAAV